MFEMRGSVLADDGVRLSYKRATEGPHNLLLMHGWAGSANNWDGVIRALALARFPLLRVIFGGAATPTKPPLFFTNERLAKDALAIADASGVQRLTAVGFSVSCRFIQTCCCWPVACGSYGNRRRLSDIRDRTARCADRRLGVASRRSPQAARRTLRVSLTPFQRSMADPTPPIPTLILAGASDTLFSPPVKPAIAANYLGSQMIELDCAHEFLIETLRKTPEHVAHSSPLCRLQR